MDFIVPINNELEERIADAFRILDLISDDTIETHEVGNVLRFLGCAPTEQEVNQIITDTQSDKLKGYVELKDFLPYVSQLLFQRKMEPAPAEKLLDAFELLDPELKGFLTKEHISKLMMEEGEPFTQEELDCMLRVAIDPTDGRLPYEFYLNQLKHSPPISIYDIAEAVLIESEKKSQLKAKVSKEKEY